MAPQLPAGQPDLNSILPILALAMNRKGGGNSGDMSNIFNELMGVMSNSYSAPSQMSDEEIMSVYAPQTISLQNTNDPILQGILADIQSGTPALKIKEAIRQGIAGGTITPPRGAEDLSLYDSLVDDLFAEKKQVDQKRYEIQNKETIYEKYGLPDPSEQFDVTQLFPETFSPMFDRLTSTQKEVDKRMREIELAAGDPNVYTPGYRVAKGSDKVDSIDPNLPYLLKEPKSIDERYPKGYRVAKLDDKVDSIDPDIPYLLKEPKNYSPKLDARATAMKKAAIAYQKELAGAAAPQRTATLNVAGLKDPFTGKDVDTSRAVQGSVTKIPTENLRDPVLQQQKLIDLVTQKVQAGLAARGETPFNQALLNRIIVNQSMGK
jgi:hypothetical protein